VLLAFKRNVCHRERFVRQIPIKIYFCDFLTKRGEMLRDLVEDWTGFFAWLAYGA